MAFANELHKKISKLSGDLCQAIHPATTTHSQFSAEELADQGIKPNTVRLSVSAGYIDDIIADLEKGFAAVK